MQAHREDTVKGANGKLWEVVVGMEVHAQITAKGKLFSRASTGFADEPNTRVSLVDVALPGMLPVLNGKCVEQGMRTALGLGGKINTPCHFDRKHYFYPDLPFGYQISQYGRPLSEGGKVWVPEGRVEGSEEGVWIGIERLHLEQDAGKSLHDVYTDGTAIDLNRAGSGLMEIVSAPHIRSAEGARGFLRKLRALLRILGVCDGNMEEGSMRADVNVSVRPWGEDAPLGVRCEIKNVNSIRFVGRAVTYEAERQVKILEAGGEVVQQTRLFDAGQGKTFPMRAKEEAHDYRYFPDPDLPVLEIEEAWIEKVRASLPELPDARYRRHKEGGLLEENAWLLALSEERGAYFDKVVAHTLGAEVGGEEAKKLYRQVANWVIVEMQGLENRLQGGVSPENLGELLAMINEGEVASGAAKEVLEVMYTQGRKALEVVEERGLRRLGGGDALEAMIEKVVAENPNQVAKVKEKPQVLGWLVGQVMKESGGRADPKVVREALEKLLEI